MSTQTIGQWGERQAERFLAGRGFTVRGRNVRYREGEIDLVCLDGDCLVLVEVKVRSSQTYGDGETSIAGLKFQRLAAAAERYCAENDWRGEIRFDAVVLEVDRRQKRARLRHLRDIWWESEQSNSSWPA